MTNVLFNNECTGLIGMCDMQRRYNNYRGNSMQSPSYRGKGGGGGGFQPGPVFSLLNSML